LFRSVWCIGTVQHQKILVRAVGHGRAQFSAQEHRGGIPTTT
jgi:hypothetical protein